ncbi:hypothetical protein CFE70_000095 [Pyrenophora teres f. teres 0-1]
MASSHIFCNALPSDAGVIAAILALSWDSPFSQLQVASTDPHTLVAAITPRIAQQIADKMQWTVPSGAADAAIEESAEQRDERQKFEDEVYYKSLPEYCNKRLVIEFSVALRTLRERVLCGRTHFLLENVATHPNHRRQGLAAQLIGHILSQADEQDVLVYLDTASDNSAVHLYKRLGFEEQGRQTITSLSRFVDEAELERSGVGNDHTRVTFVRYPITKA